MQADGGGARSFSEIPVLPYTLVDHVFACRDGSHVVLLDLKQDRYFSIDGAQVRGFENLVCGWPRSAHPDESVANGKRAADQFLARGFLVRSDAAAPGTNRLVALRPMFDLVGGNYEDHSPLRVRQLATFVAATVRAGVLLRMGLRWAVTRVRLRNLKMNAFAGEANMERIKELVLTFTAMRPFLFTSRDACLFESLALIEYLARHSVFPTWVFGVRARPFAAHCWVQADRTVLNDSMAHVARFEPILTV